jgi:50S ribosomal protein L16 3-hydroxylase
MFLPGALPESLPQLTADELAWLATLPDVESRIVFTERQGEGVSYRLEQGPFDDAALRSLPAEDWTLLVQDVDKHLPDFRAWIGAVNFVPDWRVDDLMVSLAAPGGSVGPHRDNYDVFLCQGTGLREWQLGDPADATPDLSSDRLSLLCPFNISNRYEAAAGDLLYLPPGVPHWGIARDLCMTYSIGMRAPTRLELQLGLARLFDNDDENTGNTSNSDHFYTDPDLKRCEATPGQISPETLARVRNQGLLDDRLTDAALARVIGCVVTDPKAWLTPDSVAKSDIPGRDDEKFPWSVHGMARIAWVECGEDRLVFVNGAQRSVDAEGLQFAQSVCETRAINRASLADISASKAGRDLLRWMFSEGLFDAVHSE